MEPIRTARLLIRNFVPEDWRALQALVIAHSATPVAQYDHAWPTSDEGVQGAANWFAGGDDFLAVCLPETGRLIGYLALNPGEAKGVYNLGYMLQPDYRGQGYGTEAARAGVQRLFDELGADRIETGTALANEPSCRLLRRLGFVEVGRQMGSLREDDAGRPVEFEGASLVLTRKVWEGAQEA